MSIVDLIDTQDQSRSFTATSFTSTSFSSAFPNATTKTCPFDGTNMKQIVYFNSNGVPGLGGTDEDGNDYADKFICMTCGFEAVFNTTNSRGKIQARVAERASDKSALLALKEQLRDSRKRQHSGKAS